MVTDDDEAWRHGTGGRMSGSGSRDGFGSPPWEPAPEPARDQDETPTMPGIGATAAAGTAPGPSSAWFTIGGRTKAGHNGAGSNGSAQNGAAQNGSAHNGTGQNGAGPGTLGGVNGTATSTGKDEPGEPGQGEPSDAGEKSGQPHKKSKHRSFWRELPVLIVIALALALLIKTFAIQAFYIPSASMEDTLNIGDRVLINKVVYHLRPIHRGDIIVFDGSGSWDFNTPPSNSNIFSKAIDELEGIVGISHDSSIYIKRVIGLPGDHVKCCTQGKVTVNGIPISEGSYLFPGNSPSLQRFSTTVPAGRLWVMGDHRDVSYDSRGHQGDPGGGTIPESGVLGRAFVIIWPPSRWGILNIPATFEQPQLNSSNAAAGGSATALTAAMANGTPVQQAASPIPLVLGLAGALPLTWLQRAGRRRLAARRSKRG